MDLLIGLLILIGLPAATWFHGRRVGRRREQRRATDAAAEPRCLCADMFTSHDPTTGRCLAEHQRHTRQGIEWVRCECTGYTGPPPLYERWTPTPAAAD